MIRSLIKAIIDQLDSTFNTSFRQKISNILAFYRNSNTLNAIRRNASPVLVRLRYKLAIQNKYNLNLHLGCGNSRRDGYINVDWRKTTATDLVCDIKRLPYPENSVDLIETYHVIEHLPRHHLHATLRNWYRILTPGGRLIIECPDFDEVVDRYLKDDDKQLEAIFGHQRFQGDSHLFGYNFDRLSRSLKDAGYINVMRKPPTDYHTKDWPCLRVECDKIDHSTFLSHRSDDTSHMQFTGERVIEGLTPRRIWLDHTARYHFAGHYVKDGVVLDIACGTGFGSKILKSKGAKFVHAVDISHDAIAFATKHYSSDSITLKVNDILHLDFPSAFFDVICCFETIEHVENADQALSELKRVLKPEGVLIISSPNRQLTSPGKSLRDTPDNIYHVTEYTLKEILAPLSRYFDIVGVYGQREINRLLLLPIIKKILKYFRPQFYSPDNGSFIVSKSNPAKLSRYNLLVCNNTIESTT